MQPVQGQQELASQIARVGEGLKAVVDASASLNEWTLLAMGGTLAVVLSTSYRKPEAGWKRIYLLILPALGLLGIALQRGFVVRGSYIAFFLRKESEHATADAIDAANRYFSEQIYFFDWALMDR